MKAEAAVAAQPGIETAFHARCRRALAGTFHDMVGKKHRRDRGAHDIHHIVPDQYGRQQRIIFLQQGQRALRLFLPGTFHRLQPHAVGSGKSRFRRGKESGEEYTQNQGKP